ncbi:MAG: STAS domain-containing protein [Deferrisomatales bacterium]|nr:STAS domain-containing protein [Deferrisomatales bacterium]
MADDKADGTDAPGSAVATEWTVWQAPEIRAALLDRLAAQGALELDLGAVTEVDLLGLQLLCSAHRTASARGQEFRVSRWSAAFEPVIESAGLPRHQGCRDGCLWIRGSHG